AEENAGKRPHAPRPPKPQPAPAARTSGPPAPRQGIFRAQADAFSRSRAVNWRLCRRLPRRRQAVADRWAVLASHAAVAQPQLGQFASCPLSRALRQQCQEGGLERTFSWRYVAAARRPDDIGPY